MKSDLLRLTAFDRFKDFGPLILRVFVGIVLIWGTQDNVFSHDRMMEFADFLEANGFRSPVLLAHVSAYAQFLCGALILVGFLTRWAALVMVFNFTVALIMVHWGLPFFENIAPMSMLVGSAFLVLYGPGKWSVENRG